MVVEASLSRQNPRKLGSAFSFLKGLIAREKKMAAQPFMVFWRKMGRIIRIAANTRQCVSF
jgi:hypothetical protein